MSYQFWLQPRPTRSAQQKASFILLVAMDYLAKRGSIESHDQIPVTVSLANLFARIEECGHDRKFVMWEPGLRFVGSTVERLNVMTSYELLWLKDVLRMVIQTTHNFPEIAPFEIRKSPAQDAESGQQKSFMQMDNEELLDVYLQDVNGNFDILASCSRKEILNRMRGRQV